MQIKNKKICELSYFPCEMGKYVGELVILACEAKLIN
jgi:hypothetical protein